MAVEDEVFEEEESAESEGGLARPCHACLRQGADDGKRGFSTLDFCLYQRKQ